MRNMLDVPSDRVEDGRNQMDRIRNAWAPLTNSPARLALTAAIALVAVAGGVAFAVAVNGIRQPIVGGSPPSADVAIDLSESEDPSPSPTPMPITTPMPSPTASAAPSPTATVVPSPTPELTATPTPTPQPAPVPGACDSFAFTPATAVTVHSLAELEDGIVGTWVGCLTTPWVPRYWVTITFRADGTYSGYAEESAGEPAFYYGTDEDMSEKLYELNDLEDDLEGVGQIDIVFWEGNTNRGDLRNIRLTGNELEFEFFHRGEYGPLLYQLYRASPSD
jgi:hypothetical protein